MHQTEVSTMEEDEMKPLEADVAPQRRRTAVHRPSSIQASRATTFLSSISPRAVMADEEVPESAAQDDYEAAEEEEESRGPPPATSTRQVLTRNRGYGADGVSRGCRRQITFLSTVGNLMATRGRTEESVVATKARHHRSSSSSSSGRHDGESVATTPPMTMATDGMEYLASKPSSLTVQNIVTGDGQVARLRFVLAPQPSVACSSSSSRSVSVERTNHRREATRNWKNATEELTCDGCREKADAYSAGMDSASPTSTTVDAVAELSGARPHALSPLPPGAAATPTSPTQSRSSSMRRTSPSARSQSSSVPRNVVKRTATSRRRPSTTLVRAAATPVSLCTILINYAPRGTLLWKEGQVVKPYRGESFSRESSRSNSSSSSTHSHSSGKSASGEDEGGSRPTGAGAERSRRGGGRTRTEMDMMDGADDEDENTYQDFVVNGAYLRGNYEDCHVSSSTSSESSDKEHHHRTASGGDDDGKSSSSHSRSSSNSSRSSGHSSRSSSSATTGGKGRGMHSERGMRSYGKLLNYTEHRRNAAFDNAFFLDSGNITGGERRRKCIVLPSYRTSVISFVDKKILKKDLNHNFYVQHPELEVRELKLTQLRKIKNELLVYALEDGSLLELSTVAHAYWYFERLVVQGMVGKHNRKVILAACILLAVKFLETGDVLKKLAYFRARWRRFHFVGGMLGGGREEGEEDDEDSVDWSKVEQNEFKVYVGLHFTLLPDVGSTVINTHIERLLQQINVTSSEYYSKNFVAPVYLNNYNYYSNLYY